MKTILKIAAHELKLLFCSPVAWLLLLVFLYQFGDAYAEFLSNMTGVEFPGYTYWLFSANLLPGIDGKIYFYIPLLTMGLMSQELNSGSIKLLFSAPVKTSSIVLGKYFGIMGYWLIVITVFSLFIIPAWFMIPNMDLGIILPGILAIFLLACTYSAIGLFMSCLTTYQVVAALSTLTALAALNYVGSLWQGVSVLKDITRFLHIAGHAENMNSGFVKSKDIIYFIIISLLFLGLAVFYLEDMLRHRTKSVKIQRYIGFIALMLLLGCVFSLRNMTLYFDTTAIKFNTISTSSQAALARIKGPVKITAYSNLLDSKNETATGLPENRVGDFNFWEPYIRFLPQLELHYVNYYASDDEAANPLRTDTLARRNAEANGWYIEDFLTPEQISGLIDLKPEGFTFVRKIEHGKQHKFLRVYSDPAHVPRQQEIMTVFNSFLTAYPKIGFLTGHHEVTIEYNEDRGYKLFVNEGSNRGSLINQGFDVQSIAAKQSIPAGIDALVIADPLTAFSTEEISKVQAYIVQGGNLLITGGPGCQAILNPLVAPLGIRYMDGQLIQRNPDFSPDMVFTHSLLREGGDPYPFQFGNSVLGMPGSVGLKYETNKGFKVEEAVISDADNTWNKIGEIPADTSLLKYEPGNGDTNKQLPVALSLTRDLGKKQQRIMVTGNSSFMNNENIMRDYKEMPAAHAHFAYAVFKWLGNDRYPIKVDPLSEPKDMMRTVSNEAFAKYRLYYIWLLPVLVFASGLIFLLRRRRK